MLLFDSYLPNLSPLNPYGVQFFCGLLNPGCGLRNAESGLLCVKNWNHFSSLNDFNALGIDFIIGRFHNVYGPRMGFEHVIPEFIRKCVKNESFVVQSDGSETRCFCYISDAINALILLMNNTQSNNSIFNIGSTEETEIRKIIPMLEEIRGKKINPIYKEFKNAGTPRRVPDIRKIQKLGYLPQIPLKEGLNLTYKWYSEYYRNH